MATLKSIKFPFQKGSSSFPSVAEDDDAIRSSLIQLFSTSKQERVMRPGYGVNLHDYVFESDSESTRNGMEREIRSAVAKWEPRISIDAITIETDERNEPGQFLITVFYTIVQSGKGSQISIGVG